MAICISAALRAGDNGSVPSVAVPSDPVSLTMGIVSAPGNYAFAADNNITAAAYMDAKISAAVSYTMWNVEALPKHIPAVAAAFRFGNWGFAFSARTYVDGSAYIVYDDDGAENGICRPYDAGLSAGVAYAFGCGLSVGLVARGVYSMIHPDYRALVAAGDVYLGYDSRYVGATVAVTNLGMPVRYYSGAPASYLPMLVRAGADVRPVKGLRIGVEGDYMLNNSSWMLAAGAQYTIMGLATVRAGYHYGPSSSGNAAILPSYASAGVGFHFRGFSIDASYLFASPVLKNTFSIGISYTLTTYRSRKQY